MSSNQIPGVPEGWEIEHVSRFGEPGEYCVNPEGEPHLIEGRTIYRVCVIRKVVKPDVYRPFANAEEFKPHRDRWVRVIKEHNMSGCDLDDWLTDSLRFMGQDKTGVCAPGGWLTYGCAFDCFVFDDDGTPFGVRIDE
jgi:hypothetical protein